MTVSYTHLDVYKRQGQSMPSRHCFSAAAIAGTAWYVLPPLGAVPVSYTHLADYKGKTVEKWTVLCPQLSTGDHDTYCVLLVYKAKAAFVYLHLYILLLFHLNFLL